MPPLLGASALLVLGAAGALALAVASFAHAEDLTALYWCAVALGARGCARELARRRA